MEKHGYRGKKHGYRAFELVLTEIELGANQFFRLFMKGLDHPTVIIGMALATL